MNIEPRTLKGLGRWVYRLRMRWELWRSYGEQLNRRAEVEAQLFYFAGSGQACPPEVCRKLAIKLGVKESKKP